MQFYRRYTVTLVVSLSLLLFSAVTATAQDLEGATQPVVDFIAANPDKLAVVCGVAGADPSVVHNADEQLPVASSIKIFTLLELARQADAGQLDLTESIDLDAVNAYWLPGTDAGAQQQWLASLGEEAETATLTEIADGMIRFSSNANADFLLAALGSDGFETLYADLGLENTDVPSSLLGLFLVMNNHETGPAQAADLDAATFAAESERLALRYLEDQAWVEEVLTYLTEYQNTVLADEAAILPEVERQAAFFAEFGPQSSATDLYIAIEGIYGDTYLDESARSFMRNLLDWPMDQPANAAIFENLATKGGSLSGILSSAWYAQALESDAQVLTVIYSDVPSELWLEWIGNFVFQIFEVRALGLVGEDCGVFEAALADG